MVVVNKLIHCLRCAGKSFVDFGIRLDGAIVVVFLVMLFAVRDHALANTEACWQQQKSAQQKQQVSHEVRQMESLGSCHHRSLCRDCQSVVWDAKLATA